MKAEASRPSGTERAGRGLAIMLGALLAWVITTVDGMGGWLAASVAVVALALFLIFERSWSMTSPAIVVPGVYVAISLLGPSVLPRLEQSRAVSAALQLTPSEAQGATLLFLVAALSLLVGATIHEVTIPRGRRNSAERLVINVRSPMLILTLAALPAVLLVAGTGPGYLIHRSDYLGFAGSRQLINLGGVLSLPSVALVACVMFSTARRKARATGALLLAGYLIIFFARGSRQLALLPLLVFMGWLLSPHRGRRVWPWALATLSAVVVVFSLPLALRTLTSHGLQPYTQYVLLNPHVLLSPKLGDLASNVLFSFSLTGHVSYNEQPISPDIFWVMVNPLPGTSAGWTSVGLTQQVNPATPFNAIGQLGNLGWPYLVGYFAAVGVFLAHMSRFVHRRLPSSWRPLALTATTGIAAVFALTTLQYSVRTASRFLYYAMALEALAMAVAAVTASRRSHRSVVTAPA